MTLVCAECTLDGLGPVVAAEFASNIDRFVRKHLEDLSSESYSRARVTKQSTSCVAQHVMDLKRI